MPTVPTVFGAEITLPAIGFGTGGLKGGSGVDAIGRALDVGYRLLDSAVNYENEGAVGRAVRQSSVPREEIIVTSKLPGRHHAYDEAIVTIEESLFRTAWIISTSISSTGRTPGSIATSRRGRP